MSLCDDCPRVGHSTDETRCLPCPRRENPVPACLWERDPKVRPALPAEPAHGNKIERAFAEFWKDPVVRAACKNMPYESMLHALAEAAFMEGSRYATNRCTAEGHHNAPDLLEALDAAYRFITQPSKSVRVGSFEKWDSTYTHTSHEYNALVEKMMRARTKAGAQ